MKNIVLGVKDKRENLSLANLGKLRWTGQNTIQPNYREFTVCTFFDDSQ